MTLEQKFLKRVQMPPEIKKHDIHKYERVKLGAKKWEVYKCVKPNCPHWIRQELVAGKVTECWRCGQEVVMTKPMAKQKKPHCLNCTRPYNRHQSTTEAA